MIVIQKKTRFFTCFFVFLCFLYVFVQSCNQKKSLKYVEVDGSQINGSGKIKSHSKSLVNFIEEVKEQNREEVQLTQKEIEKVESEEEKQNIENSKIRNKTSETKKLPTKRTKKSSVVKAQKNEKILSPASVPQKITLFGGSQSLAGLSRVKLDRYKKQFQKSSKPALYISGFYFQGENAKRGLDRAEKIKKHLISSGFRGKTIYVLAKKKNKTSSQYNFEWAQLNFKP